MPIGFWFNKCLICEFLNFSHFFPIMLLPFLIYFRYHLIIWNLQTFSPIYRLWLWFTYCFLHGTDIFLYKFGINNMNNAKYCLHFGILFRSHTWKNIRVILSYVSILLCSLGWSQSQSLPLLVSQMPEDKSVP